MFEECAFVVAMDVNRECVWADAWLYSCTGLFKDSTYKFRLKFSNVKWSAKSLVKSSVQRCRVLLVRKEVLQFDGLKQNGTWCDRNHQCLLKNLKQSAALPSVQVRFETTISPHSRELF